MERILKILLDPIIPQHKVCKEKPSGVTSSVTFVVDKQKLQCVDYIKKDEFGIWNYSGSHPQVYKVHDEAGCMSVEKCGTNAMGRNVVYLHRPHCIHPSNPEFKGGQLFNIIYV